MVVEVALRRDNERAMRQTVPIDRRDLQEERALIERLPFSCCAAVIEMCNILSVTSFGRPYSTPCLQVSIWPPEARCFFLA